MKIILRPSEKIVSWLWWTCGARARVFCLARFRLAKFLSNCSLIGQTCGSFPRVRDDSFQTKLPRVILINDSALNAARNFPKLPMKFG